MDPRETVEVIDRGLLENFSTTEGLRYRSPALQGRQACLVTLGRCNYRCPMCFTGGDRAIDGLMPNAVTRLFSELVAEVRRIASLGSIIRISGGEPTLFPKQLLALCQAADEEGAPIILDTNGSKPAVISDVAPYLSVLSVDGPKASADEVEAKTGGIAKIHCWDRTLETLHLSHGLPRTILCEFKVVVVTPKDLEHARLLASSIPENAFLLLKNLRLESFRNLTSNDHCRPSITLEPQVADDDILRFAKTLAEDHPTLRGRLSCVIGSTGKASSFFQF